jgi:predicted RNase H-like nuclease (RuvC/YqgF family)
LLVNYPETFKQKMVLRMSGPPGMSASALSEEVGVAQTSLSKWLREAAGGDAVAKRVNGKSSKAKVGKRPQDWTAEEKLEAVLEAVSLSEQELGAYLRRKGLHEAQLEQWRCRVTEAAKEALQSKSSRKKVSAEAKRVRELERELRRKEKALAETAALLVLKKKAAAIWGDEDDSMESKNGK